MSARVVLPPQQPSVSSITRNNRNQYPQQQQQKHPSSSNINTKHTPPTTPTTTSSTNASNATANSVTWRKRGEQLRASLIEQDNQQQQQSNGGTQQQTFILSSSVPIYRYYEVADKVFDQFLHHPIDTREELLEAYMVGQRLMKFLSNILPTHNEYYNEQEKNTVLARERSLEQLNVVTKYIEQIALLIDKQEHEDYISSVISSNSNNLHQFDEEKSNKNDTSIDRENTYYIDDDDDIDHDQDNQQKGTTSTNSNLSATAAITSRGSDSTERQNNISSNKGMKQGSSGGSNAYNDNYKTSSSSRGIRSQQQHVPTASVRPSNTNQSKFNRNNVSYDGSVISDSIDVCIVDSNDPVPIEEHTSTPSHTIIRVVSPSQQKASASDDHPSNKSVNDSYGSGSSVTTANMNNGLPIVRSHWVANRPTKNYTPSFVPQTTSSKPKNTFTGTDTSISSMEDLRCFGSNGDTANRSHEQKQQRSPERSVRTIIRSWPPKQDPPGSDPPGVATTNPRTVERTDDASVNETATFPKTNVAPKETESPEIKRSLLQSPTAEIETITCHFKPMTELQVMATEMDKQSPSRNHQTSQLEPIIRHKWSDAVTTSPTSQDGIRFRRDPSIGRHQRVRFTPYMSSSSVSSCDRSSTSVQDEDDNDMHLQTRNTSISSPSSTTAQGSTLSHHIVANTSYTSQPSNVITKVVENKNEKTSDPELPLSTNDLNVSLDSVGFPKIADPIVSPVVTHFPIINYDEMATTKTNPVDHGSSSVVSSTPSLTKPALDKHATTLNPTAPNSLQNLPASIGSHRQQEKLLKGPTATTDLTFNGNTLAAKEASVHASSNFEEGVRRSAPVDLDESISSTDAKSLNTSLEILSTSHGFATDGLDYMLPLPKDASGTRIKDASIVTPYAPSAADWSIDEDIEPGKNGQRFVRESSTISIDSTEFSSRADRPKRIVQNEKRSVKTVSPQPLETPFGHSNDWSPVWSPHDFDSLFANENGGDATKSASSVGRPDLSYEAWDDVWSDATKKKQDARSVDSRKETLAKSKSLQGSPTPTTDRTNSTGSSTTTNRSRDISNDFGQSPTKMLLFDPFASRSSVEAPFLRDETESTHMIDSKTEQRLRISTNDNTDETIRSSSRSLHLTPAVGLYGGLKGFQSLNNAQSPFDSKDEGVTSRGSIMFCRSRATPNAKLTTHHQRTPNDDDDLEESSLLMVDTRSDHKFKNCVRFLLK